MAEARPRTAESLSSPPPSHQHLAHLAQAIPLCVKLQINFIFLFNIVRILMTKLRASTTSETIQYR